MSIWQLAAERACACARWSLAQCWQPARCSAASSGRACSHALSPRALSPDAHSSSAVTPLSSAAGADARAATAPCHATRDSSSMHSRGRAAAALISRNGVPKRFSLW
jgi:hypothetical protein